MKSGGLDSQYIIEFSKQYAYFHIEFHNLLICVWLWLVYITLAKANLSVDVTGFGPYTWANCEERGKNVG